MVEAHERYNEDTIVLLSVFTLQNEQLEPCRCRHTAVVCTHKARLDNSRRLQRMSIIRYVI